MATTQMDEKHPFRACLQWVSRRATWSPVSPEGTAWQLPAMPAAASRSFIGSVGPQGHRSSELRIWTACKHALDRHMTIWPRADRLASRYIRTTGIIESSIGEAGRPAGCQVANRAFIQHAALVVCHAGFAGPLRGPAPLRHVSSAPERSRDISPASAEDHHAL
jgi:hypothetical protein